MIFRIFALTVTCLALAACGREAATETETTATAEATPAAAAVATGNPLLEEWDTPFGVPPFDRIKSENYLPALRTGIAEEQAEIDAITENSDAATFDNTIVEMERSGSTLADVYRVFNGVDGSNTDDVLKETAKFIAPELATHNDNILLNMALFERVMRCTKLAMTWRSTQNRCDFSNNATKPLFVLVRISTMPLRPDFGKSTPS